MKNSKLLKTFLVLSGVLLTVIGGASLFSPEEMKAGAGIDLLGNTSLINDVRAFGALVLSIAILSIVGAFASKLTYTSSLVSFLFFLSIGFGRLVSIFSDGMPVDGLVKATGLELVLGVIGAILFITKQDKKRQEFINA